MVLAGRWFGNNTAIVSKLGQVHLTYVAEPFHIASGPHGRAGQPHQDGKYKAKASSPRQHWKSL